MKVLLDIKKTGKGDYAISGLGFHLVHLTKIKNRGMEHFGIYIVTDEIVAASLKQVLRVLELEIGKKIYFRKKKVGS